MSTTSLAPDRAALSGLAAGVTFAAGTAGMLLRADGGYPQPGSDVAAVRRFFRGNRAALIGVAGQVASAVALARFTGSVVRLAGRSGPGSGALQAVAAGGGALAVASLGTSAATFAMLTTEQADDDERAMALHRRAFLAGGIVHGVGFGALVGALGTAGLRTGELSRGLSRAALGAAAAGLLTPLYLADERAAYFIPAGRFGGLVVTGASAVRLAGRSR